MTGCNGAAKDNRNEGGVTMRMIAIGGVCVTAVLAVLLFSGAVFAGGAPKPYGFNVFYRNLKQAVKNNNRKVIAGLMADQFQWADDTPKVSKGEAFANMDSFKIWTAFQRALETKPIEMADSSYPKGCVFVWDKKRRVGFIFDKVGGKWKWVELRAY